MDSNTEIKDNKDVLSLSTSPSRQGDSKDLDDDLVLSSPNSSLDKTTGPKDKDKETKTDKAQESSPQKSRESTPEKKELDQAQSTDQESSKVEDVGKTEKSQGPTPSASTSSDAPSTSSTSPASDKKRKFTSEEEEQIIKRIKKQDEERMKMQVLVSNFSEEQLNRYEMFRRATFPRAAIKRLMQNITGATVSQNVVIAMSGISKVFVGEVLETALDVSEKWGDSGPLQPKHLREAVRILNAKGMMPTTKSKKSLF